MLGHKTTNKKVRLRFFIVIILLVDIAAFYIFCVRLQPIIESLALSNAKNTATMTINNAVGEALKESEVDYDSLMTLEKDSTGEIKAVKANTIGINLLKHDITEEVVKEIEQIDNTKLSIPIGTVMGGPIFSGRGPRVYVKIDSVGYVHPQIVNQFTSTGINQTRQQIFLQIDVTMTVLVSSYCVSTEVSANYPIADTVIVGNVPNSYTVIDESGSLDDTAKKVYMYKNSGTTGGTGTTNKTTTAGN